MAMLNRIPSWLTNKYLLTSVAFVLWITFFDDKDLLTQRERNGELEEMQESKAYYLSEIAKEKKALEELKSNPAAIERLAREKYLMKRDNEDLFLIEGAEKAE